VDPAWTEHRREPATGRRLRGRPDFLVSFASLGKRNSPCKQSDGETAFDFPSFASSGKSTSPSKRSVGEIDPEDLSKIKN
jgi:hypothetical protein